MLSIVIPALGRAPTLGRVLERLARQDVGTDAFEVLIGIDAAERDVASICAVAGGRPFATRAVQATSPGVSAARNRVWPEARHEVVLFLGADMLPAPDLLSRHLAYHEAHPDPRDALVGHVRWARELKTTPFMRWLDEGMQFDFGTIDGARAAWWHFVAANASVKKELLGPAGGFDERFRFGYEEMDLAYRLNELGLRLGYDPRAEVEHLHPPTLDGWRLRMRLVARAERQFVSKHADMQPYFLPIFERAAAAPRLRGRAARLARFVPRRVPKLGPLVWDHAELWFAQQLAPAFLGAWDEAGSSAEAGASGAIATPPSSPSVT
ncbi:MAG: glycosyltransferase family 2 protein [Actinomycetota bacterium]